MKNYPALKLVSGIYRFCAILAGAAFIFVSAVSGNMVLIIFGTILGVVIGATLFAIGELILLFIRIEHNTEKTSTNAERTNIALLKIYRGERQQAEPKKPLTRLSQRKRA